METFETNTKTIIQIIIRLQLGNFLHGLIMVPYYPWKMSHHHHHKNTGNIDKDEVFYPVRQSEGEASGKGKNFLPFFGLGLAWFLYLTVGYAPRKSNHLNPFDPQFVKHAVKCLLSIVVCSTWIGLLLGYYTLKVVFLVLHNKDKYSPNSYYNLLPILTT